MEESESPSDVLPLDLDRVLQARVLLDGIVHRTPVLSSATVNDRLRSDVVFKAEQFQRTGSFKFRGAYNVVGSMSSDERALGVCTVSSGNHAQALALAARLIGTRMLALMPHDAPGSKVAAVRDYGAEVEFFDRYRVTQSEVAQRLVAESELNYVSAHDDIRVCAGAGTAALELIEDAASLDLLVAPVGGGGGLAGYAAVTKALLPACAVIGVEPAASAVNQRSLVARKRLTIAVPRTIADGQTVTTPGAVNFRIMQRTVDDIVLVTDEEIISAMLFLFERLKIVAEPSGAAAFAAVLAGRVAVAGKRVGVMVTGGNVGVDRFSELLAPSAAK